MAAYARLPCRYALISGFFSFFHGVSLVNEYVYENNNLCRIADQAVAGIYFY